MFFTTLRGLVLGALIFISYMGLFTEGLVFGQIRLIRSNDKFFHGKLHAAIERTGIFDLVHDGLDDVDAQPAGPDFIEVPALDGFRVHLFAEIADGDFQSGGVEVLGWNNLVPDNNGFGAGAAVAVADDIG